MRAFESVSPSQINNFRNCNRLWYYQSILGIKTPQKASAALGEAVHKQVEAYLENGTKPDGSKVGKIAASGLKYLPEPGSVFVELNFGTHEAGQALTLAGVKVSGRIDMINMRATPPEIVDHKTTSDIDKWGLTSEELRSDPQMLIYGRFLFAFAEHQGDPVDDIVVRHIQYQTQGATKAETAHAQLHRSEVTAAWNGHLTDSVTQMRIASNSLTGVDGVKPNWAACNNYGGCFFKDQCNAKRRIGAKEGPVGLLDVIKKNQAQTPATVATKPTNPLLARALGTTPTLAAKPEPAILPPDAPTDDEALEQAIAAEETKKATVAAQPEEKGVRRPSKFKERLGALGWTERQVALLSAESMVAILDQQTKPDGWSVLPSGALVAVAPTGTEAFVATVPAPAAEPQRAPAPVEQVRQAAREALSKPLGLVLYVDCYPEKGPDAGGYTLLEDLLAPMCKAAAEYEADAIRKECPKTPSLVYNLIPYGRGGAYIAAQLTAKPPQGIVVANTRYPATAAALEVLVPLSDVMIRGARW